MKYLNRYTNEDLLWLQSKSLDEKICHCLDMAEIFYMKMKGNVYLSFSGGLDSTVLKYLLDAEFKKRGGKLWDKIPSVYCDTGLEYPEVREFVKSFDDVEIIRPEMNFVETIRTFGYPLIRKEVAQAIEESRRVPGGAQDKRMHGEYISARTGKKAFDYSKFLPLKDLPIPISHKCCKMMKKDPFKKYQKKTGLYPIVGTTTEESILRKSAWIGVGCNTFDKGKEKCRPISIWKNQDILQFAKDRGIDIAKCYGDIVYVDEDGNYMDVKPFTADKCKLKCTGCDRTGCAFCSFGMHSEVGETRYQRLKRTHPKLYEFALDGGEWVNRDGKQLWVASKKGLGFAKVFDMVNDIYGKEFYRYE